MLNPVQAIAHPTNRFTATEIERKQAILLDLLTRPAQALNDRVVAFFAHGAEAMRVMRESETEEHAAHTALQTWSAQQERWVTQKTQDPGLAGEEICTQDAESWYPHLTDQDVLHKWGAIVRNDEFESRAHLAEFFYDVNVVIWNDETVIRSNPFEFMLEVSKAALGLPQSRELDAKRLEKVHDTLGNMQLEWGEFEPLKIRAKALAENGVVVLGFASLKDAAIYAVENGTDVELKTGFPAESADLKVVLRGAPDIDNIIVETSEYGGKSSVELEMVNTGNYIVESFDVFSKRNESLELLSNKENKGMTSDRIDQLIAQDAEDKIVAGFGDAYLASLTYECWTEESIENGEAVEKGYVFTLETMDREELQSLGRERGLSVASTASPDGAPCIWFSSETPEENRAFFEDGLKTYYSLHIHEVNGKEPGPEDYQSIAHIVGVKFAKPLELFAEFQEQESKETSFDL